MKKSNKLLLAGFLTLLLFITGIHIALYAKYKSGAYTAEDELLSATTQSFPNILFVSVRNVSGATVNFSDMAQVEKGAEKDIQYVQRGDTLLITAKDSTQPGGIRYPVTFHLPYKAKLSVFNSSLAFKAGKKLVENNPVIYLQKSNAFFSGTESPLQFGHLKLVAANGSNAAFQGNTQVGNLEVELSNSSLAYGEGDFGQLSIVTDSLSRLSLQSKHLLKATIKTTAPQ